MAHIDELIARLRSVESELQEEFDKRREDFSAVLEERRVRFGQDVAELQRASKIGLVKYVTGASLLSWLVAPVIYSGIVPLVLLDAFLFGYQLICFPVYRIARARRSDYVVLDRGDLPYLNALERLNCVYCGYANGLMRYGTEVASRTEQYFCPIKHGRRIVAAHERYATFFEHGDAESYRHGLERLRDSLAEPPRKP